MSQYINFRRGPDSVHFDTTLLRQSNAPAPDNFLQCPLRACDSVNNVYIWVHLSGKLVLNVIVNEIHETTAEIHEYGCTCENDTLSLHYD